MKQKAKSLEEMKDGGGDIEDLKERGDTIYESK